MSGPPPWGSAAVSKSPIPTQGADGSWRPIFGRNRGLVFPPTHWKLPANGEPPPLDAELRREYVYGYNGACPQSIHFVSDAACVYPVASIIVLHHLDKNSQEFFEGHNNDVQCLAWNSERRLCASGQQDPKGVGGPYICVWAPSQLRATIAELHGHVRGVTAVGFSPDGCTLVSFGADDNHSLLVWRDFADWDPTMQTRPPWQPGRDRGQIFKPSRKKPIREETSGKQPTYVISMLLTTSPGDLSISFHSSGVKHFKSWVIKLPQLGGQEVEVTCKRGAFRESTARRDKTPNPTCIAAAGHEVGIGMAFIVTEGSMLFVTNGPMVTQALKLSNPGPGVPETVPLGCVASLPGGRWVAGSTDGTIYVGTAVPSLKLQERFRIADIDGADGALLCSSQVPRLTAISMYGNTALFGTSNHVLLLVDIAQKATLGVLQVSHAQEAWAMDVHPSLALVVTGSKSGGIRLWNTAEHRPAVGKVIMTNYAVWSLAFHPDGSMLAAGCGRGVLSVYAFPATRLVFEQNLSQLQERICDVRYSDDGTMIGAAGWDQKIYLLKVTPAKGAPPAIRLHRVLTGNSSSAICILFSANGEFIMSNSKDNQILFWRTKDGRREQSTSAFRDTKWQSPWTCVLGWPVIGLWSDPEYDQTDVNSVCQSMAPDDGYVALGDDMGQVKLYRFPSPFVDPPNQVCGGHASHVTNVKFSCTNVLFSLGGDDHSLMQWTLQSRKETRPWFAQSPAPPHLQVQWSPQQAKANDSPRTSSRARFQARPRANRGTEPSSQVQAALSFQDSPPAPPPRGGYAPGSSRLSGGAAGNMFGADFAVAGVPLQTNEPQQMPTFGPRARAASAAAATGRAQRDGQWAQEMSPPRRSSVSAPSGCSVQQMPEEPSRSRRPASAAAPVARPAAGQRRPSGTPVPAAAAPGQRRPSGTPGFHRNQSNGFASVLGGWE
mmetsp:Transcript_65433/g.122035  ORF Transcript_65433/g.122035 Transcript_65433/m.122035 type:complete len:944 (+) Transcript_65433:32-2863(+)